MEKVKVLLAYLASNSTAIAAIATVLLGASGAEAVKHLLDGLPGVIAALTVLVSLLGQKVLRNAEPAKVK